MPLRGERQIHLVGVSIVETGVQEDEVCADGIGELSGHAAGSVQDCIRCARRIIAAARVDLNGAAVERRGVRRNAAILAAGADTDLIGRSARRR